MTTQQRQFNDRYRKTITSSIDPLEFRASYEPIMQTTLSQQEIKQLNMEIENLSDDDDSDQGHFEVHHTSEQYTRPKRPSSARPASARMRKKSPRPSSASKFIRSPSMASFRPPPSRITPRDYYSIDGGKK